MKPRNTNEGKVMATFAVLGVNADETTCHCCGRQGLKMTVALAVLDAESNQTGEVVRYGTGCAATALRFGVCKVTAKAIETAAKLIESKSFYAKPMTLKTA
jgi:hypothetical protein